MFFKDSKPDRKKRAQRLEGSRMAELVDAPIPSAVPYELLSDYELRDKKRTLVFDTESFANYWLCAFKCTETNKLALFEYSPEQIVDTQKLAFVLYRHKVVGFYSNSYDVPMVQLALKGYDAQFLSDASHRIIGNSMTQWDTRREFGLPYMPLDHIDLIEVAPISASLKIYAGRLHCPRMQDLPYAPNMVLTKEQANNARDYCGNDLDNTHLLYDTLKPQLALRETLGLEYGHDLRSRSDAQIAEHVIGSELDKLGHSNLKKADWASGSSFQVKIPDGLSYATPQLQAVLEAVKGASFIVGNGGQAEVPEAITALRIALGGCTFQMGGGGLHSTEASVGYRAGPDMMLIDRDVASYYPAIILNQGLYPSHLGVAFLEIFRTLVNKRLKAKKEKNKVAAEGLKITINGTFGKLGNFYSRLYAPDLLMQVTISGQLWLLKFIEMVELVGIPVLTANTDGIVIGCPPNRYQDLEAVVMQWENLTGFVTEETRYHSIWSRDVNNYIAVKYKYDETFKVWTQSIDGCKVKGIYSAVGSALNSPLSKNPECQIVSDAVQAFVAHNTPIAQTIYGCKDIRKFVAVRTVKGGAEKNGVYLGKAIRWYYAEGESGTINYVQSGNNVPKSQGARPLMILPPELPSDLDFSYYFSEAKEALYDIGYNQRPKEASLL